MEAVLAQQLGARRVVDTSRDQGDADRLEHRREQLRFAVRRQGQKLERQGLARPAGNAREPDRTGNRAVPWQTTGFPGGTIPALPTVGGALVIV